jgi:UDP-N-acetyl-D-mannosaminuronic acid dehydrogenase
MKNKTICIVGMGYIGLPTAALLCVNGFKVCGVDVNSDVVNTINSGKIHIVEPGLEQLVKNAVDNGLLKAYLEPKRSDIYILCVPTPFHEGDSSIPSPNIDFVISAAMSILPLIKKGDMIVLESTSPVGTTSHILKMLVDYGINIEDIYLAYCPERVVPGKVIDELINNDRVIGGINLQSSTMIANFYKSFVKGQVLETDAKTAEMCKLTENSFRDVNIAFANELSMICQKEDIDVTQLISLANRHPRVNILQPGCGVGGHCIAVDPWFIVSRNPNEARLIKKAREVNNYKSKWIVEQIENSANNFYLSHNNKPIIACLGLSFKPDIDDLRESPALGIAKKLIELGHNVIAVEPNISHHEKIEIVKLSNATKNADLLVVLVKHKEFVNSSELKNMPNNLILDYCGLLSESNS